jgi:hypothetical protein
MTQQHPTGPRPSPRAARPRRGLLLCVALVSLAPAACSPASGSDEDTSSTEDAVTAYSLHRTQYFPADPPAGWTTCQHRYVTLPKNPTGYIYSWEEDFANGEPPLTEYGQIHGTFYWTVCVQSMAGSGYNNWTYKEWSTLTLDDSACQTTGKCTMYQLANHYIRVTQGENREWGSQIARVTNGWCTFGACE